MQAIMIKDEYSDICPNYPYDIDRVYGNGHIRLKNSPRLYCGSSFEIYKDGKKIGIKEAYRQYKLSEVKRKLRV